MRNLNFLIPPFIHNIARTIEKQQTCNYNLQWDSYNTSTTDGVT